jgi:hypothetical protein
MIDALAWWMLDFYVAKAGESFVIPMLLIGGGKIASMWIIHHRLKHCCP